MVKAYLKYEQVAGFGVVASSAVAVQQVKGKASVPLIACAAVDTLIIWNMRTGESVARFGNASTRKAGAISAIAVSPDGETVACGYTDGSIRLWELSEKDAPVSTPFSVQEPQPSVMFNGHRSGISALAFESLPHGNSLGAVTAPSVLVSGSNDGDVILWSIVDATGLFRLSAHNDAVTSVLLFRRSKSTYIVTASKDALVKIYDADTQHCVQTIAQHRAEVWGMQLDPTNTILLTGSAGSEVYVYTLIDAMPNDIAKPDASATTAQDILTFDRENIFQSRGFVERHVATDRVSNIACTVQRGECFVVVCAVDKTAEIFRMRDSKQAEGHRKRRQKRAIMSIEKTVKGLAEGENWDAVKTATELADRKKGISFTVDAVDFLVSVRQVRMRKKLKCMHFLTERTHIPIEKGVGIELQLLIQQRDNSLEIHNAALSSLKTKKRKKLESGVSEEDATTNESKTNEIKKLVTLDFGGHRNDVRSVSLSPDESSILSCSDGGLKLWNIATEKCIRTMKFTGFGLSTLFLGADGMVGVVGSKTGMIQVFELGSGTLITEEKAHEGEVWSMCLDDHVYEANRVISGGADKRVCFWSIEDVLVGKSGKLKLTHVLEMPDQVLCVRVAYGRERPVILVSMMDSTVRGYFLDTLEPYLSFYGHKLPVMSMDVSSDGSVLATGSADKTIKLWGMDFGDCRRSLRAHSDSVLSVAFQPKTHYLFSGSRDECVKYWDCDKFEFVAELDGQRGEVWYLCVSSDGEILTTASHDRMIRVWKRTDEPIFLDEEKDRRMDELFESKLIEDDVFEASKNKKDRVGFMADDNVGEASAAGKRSMETVKGGESLLEALQLCEAETVRLAGESEESANPLMLGLSPEAYVLRSLERIKSADLEEALHLLPLDAAVRLLEYLARLMSPDVRGSRLVVEMLGRSVLYLVKLHHTQICSGAVSRKLISELYDVLRSRIENVRFRLGENRAALLFWREELLDRDDAPFRDASARAFNLQKVKQKKAKVALSKRNRNDSNILNEVEDGGVDGEVERIVSNIVDH